MVLLTENASDFPELHDQVRRTNYRLLVLNSSIARVGTSGFAVAIIWFALVITNSPVLAGFADGMGALPLFLSFAFGAYIDRLSSKKQISIIASLARGISVLVLILALTIQSILVETVAIYGVAFVVGLTSDVLNSATASWTKQFLNENEYKRGTSMMQSSSSLAQSVGYGVSGALILLGFNFAIYGFAGIFILSVVPIFFLKNETSSRVSTERNLQSSMLNGMKYIFAERRLRATIILTLIVNLAFGTVAIFFAALVDVQFQLPAIYYTVLFLSLTLGIMAGSLAGSKAKGKVGFYTVLTLCCMGVLLLLLGLINLIYPDYAVTFIIGFLIGVVNVVIMTAIVKIVEQEMMGRVMGAVNTFAISLTFMSGAIGGVLIGLLTVHGAFFLIGGILILASLLPVVFKDFYNLSI